MKKDNVCPHCKAVNSHFGFQCASQRKPIKKTGTPIGSFTMTKRQQPISKVSSKEKKRQVAYNTLRKEFMKQFPVCQVKFDGCSHKSTDVHHTFMGADRSKYFLDSSTWVSICRFCHTHLHSKLSTEELINLGLRRIE